MIDDKEHKTAPEILKSAKKQVFESKRRKFQGLSTLVPEIRTLTKKALGTRGFAGSDILEHWEDIVGVDLARGVSPQKLTFERDNRTHGTLVVKSAGGAFAMLFEHQKDRVIGRINSFFGYPAVSRIKIIQGSLKLKTIPIKPIPKLIPKEQLDELKEKVALIEDDELREKTFELGKTLLMKK